VRVEVRSDFDVQEHEVLIGYVSHLAPYKGQGTFVRAFADLVRQGVECRAAIVGGPRKSFEWFVDDLKAEVEKLGISDRLAFYGTRLDVADMMNAFDIFVCVSEAEEFNRVLVEAMCFGKPVIASDLRGGSIVLDHEHSGLLVPPKDVPALIAALKRLVTDSAMRLRLGVHGRAHARRRFSVGNVVPRYERIYESVLRDECERA
jgi:glycosyltransferase involved in cell wall biosynthesis